MLPGSEGQCQISTKKCYVTLEWPHKHQVTQYTHIMTKKNTAYKYRRHGLMHQCDDLCNYEYTHL